MSTIIGKSIFVAGNIEGKSSLTVAGRVEGTISITEDLTLDNSGVIKGDIISNGASINGVIIGNIESSGIVSLGKDAVVVGDIIAPRVSIELGAKFRGSIDMSSYDSLVKPQKSSFSRNKLSSKKSFNRFDTKKIETKKPVVKDVIKKDEVKKDFVAPAINDKLDKEEKENINNAVKEILNEKKKI